MRDVDRALLAEWLGHWHALLNDPDIPPFREVESLAGVLADLRHDPDRLARASEPFPRGDEVLQRVCRCVEAQKGSDTLYLVPDPLDATDDELRALVADALQRGCACCGIEQPSYRVDIERRPLEPAEANDTAPLVEELGDKYIELTFSASEPTRTAMYFLREGLYALAASFAVQGYCVTPLCPPFVQQLDPYEPQLALWRRRALAVVNWSGGDERVVVYVG